MADGEDVPDVTRILTAASGGDPGAANELLPLVYEQLRKLAASRLAQERPGQTLQPTALVHEAYLRLVGSDNDPQRAHFDGRAHFFAAAGEAMRRILIDRARRKQALRNGGGLERIDLDENLAVRSPDPRDAAFDELLAVDEALAGLDREDPIKANLVKLHFFAGLSLEETAEGLGLSRATAYRYWTYARAWLHHEVRRRSAAQES